MSVLDTCNKRKT